MTARETMLKRIRHAVGRADGKPVPPPAPVHLAIPEIDLESRIRLFTERLEVLGGQVYRTTRGSAKEQVAALVTGPAVASGAALLVELGVTDLPGVTAGAGREQTAAVEFGITVADYGLADTGTMVMITEPRLPSLLPPVHVALLPVERLLTGLDELLTLHPAPAEMTSSMVLITGPSRSGDIEMILVRGVHGPRAVHVIVVEG